MTILQTDKKLKNGQLIIDKKFDNLWVIITLISFFLYYSGIVHIYLFYRKIIIKRFRRIVLTYHRIRNDQVTPHIEVSIKNFELHMKHLKKAFNILPLHENVNLCHDGKLMSADQVSITFDDGYEDIYHNGFQILKKYKISATIFLISNFIGRSEYLNLKQLDDMKNSNIHFACHTSNHLALSAIKHDLMVKEINNSKKKLEKLLNTEITFFAYPNGKKNMFNDAIKREVKRSGYKAAFTTLNGELKAVHDPFEQKRIGIRNCPLFVFKVRVSGILENRIFMTIRRKFRIE